MTAAACVYARANVAVDVIVVAGGAVVMMSVVQRPVRYRRQESQRRSAGSRVNSKCGVDDADSLVGEGAARGYSIREALRHLFDGRGVGVGGGGGIRRAGCPIWTTMVNDG